MVKVGLIGAGKMGISHLSILGAHPGVDVVGVCDTSKMVTDVLEKYGSFKGFADYKKMLQETNPDAVVVAVPTKFHAAIVKDLLERNIHVFAEKPFCLNASQGEELVHLAKNRRLINQVGYHNKFIGNFTELKRLVDGGYLGNIYHFVGESYGPVVTKKKADTWRSDPAEGGGCLMDYASHVIDLVNYILSPVAKVHGAILKPIYSGGVEDAVYALLELSNKLSGVLSVNWSDETYRKMSTSITVIGTKGKIICDAAEIRIYFKEDNDSGYSKGWSTKYITDLTEQVDFYLRGEEYSAQLDYFIKAIEGKVPNTINTFESAWLTDKAIDLIKNTK
ncbi:MAG: Gfo/Idh/MocA family oxidoreductase [Chitinophagaceae bacterium]|nr:Gfo/Idh/MocA family oxidoreductase [Chitinophagaceae bacterium]